MKSETAYKYIREFEFDGQAGYRIISSENARRAVELAEQDSEGSMNELAQKIHRAAVDKGFYECPLEHGTMLMLVVSELAEALEAHRKGRYADLIAFDSPRQLTPRTSTDPFVDRFNQHIKDTFQDEIADAIIRLLDLSASVGIDIDRHIELKMHYNALRPHKHGK